MPTGEARPRPKRVRGRFRNQLQPRRLPPVGLALGHRRLSDSRDRAWPDGGPCVRDGRRGACPSVPIADQAKPYRLSRADRKSARSTPRPPSRKRCRRRGQPFRPTRDNRVPRKTRCPVDGWARPMSTSRRSAWAHPRRELGEGRPRRSRRERSRQSKRLDNASMIGPSVCWPRSRTYATCHDTSTLPDRPG